MKVTYLATLRPQPINYSKSYNESPDDWDVIPFQDIEVDAADGDCYFFDYVLRSGATWEGPISREVITISVDPKLELHPARIVHSIRRPYGNWPSAPDEDNEQPQDREMINILLNSGELGEKCVIFDLKNIKPNRDLLFAIPAKTIGQYKPKK